MNILYLAHRIPYPPNKGDKIRSYNQVKFLAAHHKLSLICLADNPEDLAYKAVLQEICYSVDVFPLNTLLAKARGVIQLLKTGTISAGYFYQHLVQKKVDDYLRENDIDIIFCFSSVMGEYVLRSSVGKKRAKLVMDFCDVDSDKWRQYSLDARQPMKSVYHLESKRLLAYESKINKHFDHSIFATKQEAALFRELLPHAQKIAIVQNGVDHDFFAPESISKPLPETRPTLLFTGAMDYHANIDAVTWFCSEIWPLILQEFPECRFYIVGSRPTSSVQALAANQGVEVIGFVDDIRPYYKRADVSVIPLRLARGVQNKVLEAMAMRRPVVTTTKAAQGVGGEHNKQVLIADEPFEFAAAVTAVLQKTPGTERLGENARDYVVSHFDWGKNMAVLNALLEQT